MEEIKKIYKLQKDGRFILPTEVCTVLGVDTGDKVKFELEPDGSVTLSKA